MIRQFHHTLVTQGPSWLRFPAQLTPFEVKRRVLLSTLEHVFKEALEDGDFEFLTDRWLRLSVTDMQLTAYISFDDDSESLKIAEQCDVPDICFEATANDLVLIAARFEDPDTLFFQRRLKIEGDTELGLEVKNLIDSVDWAVLPKPLTAMLTQLARFIETGLAPTTEPLHADQN
ncbi:ubiquinone anaerobic biosynthesis accessory factor UbiT [Thaumasiovibrio subtropicus]|uniref:ubiquinone anaerobic biosynthesis accessory factor UbiT n=1 Tax=Thaumasiovibrio subtropicus TaxID=1891207 RepID=UPI000B36175D|nr:SCP2 sterol-binding domain-containing protein [Thaumasiovibrio subtropicus]